METKLPQAESDSRETVSIDWSESEWFKIWLELARRDYQGKVDPPNSLPATMLPSRRQPFGTFAQKSSAAPGDEPHQH